jgi:uncharacterized YceG family protein
MTRRRFLVLVLGLLSVGVLAACGGSTPAPGDKVTVTIPAGATAAQIAQILEDAGVVGSASDFVERVVADGQGENFKPGTYALRTNETYDRIVFQLNNGATAETARLTIPEGYAIWDIKAAVKKVGIKPAQYQAALDAHQPPSGFLTSGEQAATLEGFLFPATYDVAVPAAADALVSDQLAAFSDNWASVDMTYASSKNLTRYDVLKIASLIEREAQAPDDRAKIASVIYNRLRAGMSLGIDASVQYGLGSWGELSGTDLQGDSPYNLRRFKGLPPTPICNPGVASMKAAANPAKTDYLYYYAIKGDPKGRHWFTNSYDAFLKYQKEHPYS